MRKLALLPLSITALSLAACSDQTQQNAERTADAIGQDVRGLAADATQAADNSARAISEAADRSAASIANAADKAVQGAASAAGEMGRRIDREAAKVEARAQNQPVDQAQAD